MFEPLRRSRYYDREVDDKENHNACDQGRSAEAWFNPTLWKHQEMVIHKQKETLIANFHPSCHRAIEEWNALDILDVEHRHEDLDLHLDDWVLEQ